MATVNFSKRPAGLPPVMDTRLRQIGRRESTLRLWTGLADALTLFLAAVLVALLLDWTFTFFSPSVRAGLTVAALATGVVGLLLQVIVPRFRRPSLADLAAQVDRAEASLEERWQTVAEITAAAERNQASGSPVLFDQVVKEAVAREHLVDSHHVVPARSFRKHWWLLAGVTAAHLVLYVVDAPQAFTLMCRFLAPTAPISLTQVAAVDGDMAVPRGEPVQLKAAVTRRPRSAGLLYLRNEQGEVTSVPLTPVTSEGTEFVHAIPAADEAFAYRFRVGDGETAWHNVSVYDRPRLTGVALRIVSPEYTNLPVVEKSELPAKVRAVEGSVLEITFSVDQPLDNFQLDLGKGESIALSAADPLNYVFRKTLDSTIRLTPHFVSRHGLENQRPPSCQVVVYPDQKPQVTIVTPDKEISVRPDDEVVVELNARDDFGVQRAELIAYVGDQPDLENALILPAEPEGDAAATPASPADANSTDATDAADPAKGTAGDERPEENAAKETDSEANPANKDPGKAEGTPDGGKKSSNESNENKGTGDPARKSDDSAEAKAANADQSNDADKSSDANKGADSRDANSSGENARRSDPPGQQNAAGNNAQGKNQSSPGKSADNARNQNGGTGQANSTPPKTIVMPIPLADQEGGKNIRAKGKIDLGKFQLKHGERVQYMVRVYDTRNAQSQGQSFAGPQNQRMPEDAAMARAENRPPAGSPPADANAAGKEQQPGAQDKEQQPGAQDNAARAQNAGDPSAANPADPAQAAQNAASQSNPNAPSPANNGSARVASDGSRDPAQQASGANQNSGDTNSNAQQANSAGQPSRNNASDAQGQSGSAQASSKARSDDNNSPGQITGAQRPEDSMTRRRLDVEAQSTASSAMTIHIDEWAGSFKGQQREKLELAIDPVLKELDATLARAQEYLRPVRTALQQQKTVGDEEKKSLQSVETQIERSQSLVADLVKKSEGTPYAFIGLQLVDITGLHIVPAGTEVRGITADPAEKQLPHAEQAELHLSRAREMLADLTRQYESIKRDAQLAEDLQRIKKMYQTFLEDSLAMLGSGKPTLNPKDRKMVEFELDEEFLKKYTELQERWQKILAELAKALAKDPRLLERYMNASRRSVDSLRDQLTILHYRQKDLAVPVEQLAKGDSSPKSNPPKDDAKKEPAAPAKADYVHTSLRNDLAEIARATSELQEDLTTWLPLGISPQDEKIAPLLERAASAAAAATAASAEAGKPDGEEAMRKQVEQLDARLKALEEGLVAGAVGDNAPLVEHLNRRLARTRKIQTWVTGWIAKQTHASQNEPHRALEIDQHRLAEDTLELSGKFDNLEAQLAGLPIDILDMAVELKDVMRYDVLVDQMSAELRLRDEDLPVASEHQKKAIDGLARAEALIDKLMGRVIEELDKVPVDVPDIDNAQLPTLEELLARLETEQELAELLGIPLRPTNLQQLRDWMMRSQGGQGMAGNMANGARGQQQMLERARQNAMRAIRKASAIDDAKPAVSGSRRWNTLASQLDDILRQGRGNTPPKQYQRAIDRYFGLISGAERSKDTAPSGPENPEQKPDARPETEK